MSYNDQNNDGNRKKMHFSPNLLACINNAVDNRVVATIEYESRESGSTTRDVEPMALVYKNRKRNLVAWCHLRNDWRSFRLDRIELFKLSADTFNRRDNFNVEDFEGDDDYQEYEENNNNE